MWPNELSDPNRNVGNGFVSTASFGELGVIFENLMDQAHYFIHVSIRM